MSLLALIVDDEAPARAELRFLLERIEDVEVVGEAASVREALALAARLDYDVVFCDISMPELTGIDAAREIMSWPKRPHVVFVTAHQDYAVQAFSVDAFDYLLKPVAEDRLAQTVERLRSALRGAPERAARGELAKVAVSAAARRSCSTTTRSTSCSPRATTRASRPTTSATSDAVAARARGCAAAGALLPHPPLVDRQPPEGDRARAELAGPLDPAALGRRGDDARGRAPPDASAQAAPGIARVRRQAVLGGVGSAAGLLSALSAWAAAPSSCRR